MVACVPSPPRALVESRPFVRRHTTAVVAAKLPVGCAMADSASEWRELRARLPMLREALPEDWCDFAVERALVVVIAGEMVGAPIDHGVHSEEGVDVLVLTPTRVPSQGPSTLVHALAVAAHAAPLAVVWRQPDAQGHLVETTLAVLLAR